MIKQQLKAHKKHKPLPDLQIRETRIRIATKVLCSHYAKNFSVPWDFEYVPNLANKPAKGLREKS